MERIPRNQIEFDRRFNNAGVPTGKSLIHYSEVTNVATTNLENFMILFWKITFLITAEWVDCAFDFLPQPNRLFKNLKISFFFFTTV